MRLPLQFEREESVRAREMVYRAFPTMRPVVVAGVQLPLPVALPRYSLSDLAQEVLVIVTRLAEGRIPMPSYPVLGEMASNRGRQSVAKAFDRLVNLGLIRVEVRNASRRVLVLGIAQFTGWGDWVQGHAPNTAPMQQPLESQAQPETPVVASAFASAVVPIVPEQTFAAYLRSLPRPVKVADPGPARECQFILAEYGHSGVQFCGARSAPGKSWCDVHRRVVFETRTNK